MCKFKYKKRTPRDIIETERKRLIDIPKGAGFKEWLGNREYPLDHFKEQFGETLVEITAEEVYNRNLRSDMPRLLMATSINCDRCKRIPRIDEPFLFMDNDDEYDEYNRITLCKECLTELYNFMVKKGV